MDNRDVVEAARIRQEITDLDRVIVRAERAIAAAQHRPEDQDLYLDSAALSLHDFYAGLERIFQHIAVAGQYVRRVPALSTRGAEYI